MQSTLKRYQFQAMGSYCEVQIFDDSRINAKKRARQIAGEVVRLERKYSQVDRQSFLSQMNFSAGSKLGIKLDNETVSLFDHARACYEQSDGLLDITAGILRRVWDFNRNKIPRQADIDELLPRIGFEKLEFKKNRLRLPINMEIDFGAIVRAYAADSAARIAQKQGVQHGLVNLGGDFAVIGAKPGGEPWPVGIVNPEAPTTLLAKIPLSQGGLSSTGDYSRFLDHDGTRYSLVLNPKTGWPASGLRAVSVAASSCPVARSLSAIAMLKDSESGIAWLKETGLPHAYMTADGQLGGEGTEAPASLADSTPEEDSESTESLSV